MKNTLKTTTWKWVHENVTYVQVETIKNSKVNNVPGQYAHIHTTTYSPTCTHNTCAHTDAHTHTDTTHKHTETEKMHIQFD